MQMHNHISLGRANHPQGSKINKIVNICADYMNLIITMQHPYTSAYPRTSTKYSQSKSTTKYYYSTHVCCLRTFNSMHPPPPFHLCTSSTNSQTSPVQVPYLHVRFVPCTTSIKTQGTSLTSSIIQ